MFILTCLDLAWAAVGPFFLKTVTVSQSLSAILCVRSNPVIFNLDTKINSIYCVENDPFKGCSATCANQSRYPELSPTRVAKALFKQKELTVTLWSSSGSDLCWWSCRWPISSLFSTMSQGRMPDFTFRIKITSIRTDLREIQGMTEAA